MDEIFARQVVLGAGSMGAAAAYHLARRGRPALLVEQFAPGHARGSSHGSARIARHSYPDVRYARLMVEAFAAWRGLEADAGQNLFVRTGGLTYGPPGVRFPAEVAAALAAVGVPHRLMSGRELRRALPTFAAPDADGEAVFEPDAGLVAASRAVAAQVELARDLGGDDARVLENCPIRRIDLEADRPTLVGDGLRITCERLIVAAGAWTGRLIPGLAATLQPTRQRVAYFRPPDPATFAIGRFPFFIHAAGEAPGDILYGLPDYLGTGVKMGKHVGPAVDPDAVDPVVDDAYVVELRTFLRRHLPALADAPVASTEVCLYTNTPDDHFRLGPLPGRPDVVVASPCSGHGFKFSCLIGRVLADLALDGRTDVAIDHWRLG